MVALLIPSVGRAQTAGSPSSDSIGSVFRAVIDSVGTAAGLASLRDRALPPGLQREVRAYIGFGLGYPQTAARLWEASGEAHGWFGLWWPGTQLTYEIANGTEADYAEARREQATWVTRVRELAARLGCTEFRARPDYETCTLPTEHVDWADALARLDSLGIARLPQEQDRLGFDGVTLVVEYRDAAGYRAYSYWTPRVEADDPNERAAAAIMQAIAGLARRPDSH